MPTLQPFLPVVSLWTKNSLRCCRCVGSIKKKLRWAPVKGARATELSCPRACFHVCLFLFLPITVFLDVFRFETILPRVGRRDTEGDRQDRQSARENEKTAVEVRTLTLTLNQTKKRRAPTVHVNSSSDATNLAWYQVKNCWESLSFYLHGLHNPEGVRKKHPVGC